MPIHNHIVRDAHGRPDAAGLIARGVLLSVEIGVHPSLAKKATPGPPVFGKAAARHCWSSSPPLSRSAESAARLTRALADMNAAIAVDVPNVSNR